VPLPFNLLERDIIKYPLLVFLPAGKEADLAKIACANISILCKSEKKP